MLDATVATPHSAIYPGAPAVQTGSEWLVLYTCSRQEKKVADQLRLRHVESFLPLFNSIRNWNGRRATIELPLFPGYVFVRPLPEQRVPMLSVPGAVRLVTFRSQPAVIRDSELEHVRTALAHRRVEPWPWAAAGQRVRVVRGALAGLEGVVTRRKNHVRVIITLECILRAMSVEVDASELEPVRSWGTGRSRGLL